MKALHSPLQGCPAFESSIPNSTPLICFSHLRWDFVFQRPQHLMSRFGRERRVFVWEEPIPCDHHRPYLEYHPFSEQDVIALRPRVPHWWDEADKERALAGMLDMLIATQGGGAPILWFYTPAMFAFARHVEAAVTVYDCMDELSAFRFAPPALKRLEADLLQRADVVFTGGYSLYEAKRDQHDNIHPFPSSVDVAHFSSARNPARAEPDDQAAIGRPRLGFYGVIDERMDLGLVCAIAAARPGWHIVIIGPVAKIDPATLPRASNIHFLGAKAYDELPAYLAGWDAALLPFMIDEATRFISPTKTPEYLAAGRPVVSTPIVDVVRHYGTLAGVAIAETPERFIACCAAAIELDPAVWQRQADAHLAAQSWDDTFERMRGLLGEAVERRRAVPSGPRGRIADITRPAIRPAGRRKPFDVLVAGAGCAGAVLAERLAAGAGRRVLVVDRRPHIGGNAYDYHDTAGILVHRYGPHVFHTNNRDVVDYLSGFTAWRPYEHRVLADVHGALVPMPVNRTTLDRLFGVALASDAEAEAFLAARAERMDVIRTAEDVVVSALGRELYETLFRGYSRKQWGLDPSELDKSVMPRVLPRTSADDRFFTDTFQAMPAQGYTAMFERMLDHPNIVVELETDYADAARDIVVDHTVFTGPIDAFFDHRFGPLPYRALDVRHETHERRRFQPAAIVNYPSEDVPYTRITEYKYLTGQVSPRTSISYEIPSALGDPAYPIPRPENQVLFKRYEALALARRNVSFVGRLATYRSSNMDQVVGQALATYRRLVGRGSVEAAANAGRPSAALT